MFLSGSRTWRERARLRIAITETDGTTKALAGLASHDVDGDCRHTAFNRSWFSHRDFLRFHAAVSSKDATLDRCGVGFSLQQGRSRDCGHPARRDDLGNARNLCRRIPVRLLGTESASGAAGTLSPIWTARLRALACVFTCHLACLLAGICWFALHCGPVGDIYLFSHAFADQPCADAAEDG